MCKPEGYYGPLTDREVAVCMPPLPLRHVINGHPHQLHAYRCIAMQHACRGPVGVLQAIKDTSTDGTATMA